jgi:hypothetical protein
MPKGSIPRQIDATPAWHGTPVIVKETIPSVRQGERRQTTDPLHLMRVFGISDGTAMRCITAAHHERTTKIPR